jgi:NTE family protein
MANNTSTALVLAGGGVAGIAWELGLIDGLRQHGIDLTEADLIVGTSAGATVGAQIATGRLDDAVAAQRDPQTKELDIDIDIEEFRATLAALVADAATPTEALARIGRMALETATIPEDARRAVIEARLPVHDWPAQRLVLTAVHATSGELVLFDQTSKVTLVDAVAASCAVPGVWPPTTIAGERYVDGGARSLTNADLAAGHDRVVVLVPMALVGPAQDQLDRELASLGTGVQTLVVVADAASIAAVGANPLDPARRLPSMEAGRAQAAVEATRVAPLWGDGARASQRRG